MRRASRTACALSENAAAIAARTAPDLGLVDFDMGPLPPDPVAVGPNHPGAGLVQDTEGGFVTRQPQLALELRRRQAFDWPSQNHVLNGVRLRCMTVPAISRVSRGRTGRAARLTAKR